MFLINSSQASVRTGEEEKKNVLNVFSSLIIILSRGCISHSSPSYERYRENLSAFLETYGISRVI